MRVLILIYHNGITLENMLTDILSLTTAETIV